MAFPGMTMGSAALPSGSTAHLDKFIPELWLDEVVATRENNLVLANFFRRINHQGKKGDILHLPFISDLQVQDVPADGAQLDPAPNANTEGELQIALNKWRAAPKFFSDILDVQALSMFRREYTRKMGYAMSKDIDTAIAALYADVHANYHFSGGDATTASNDAVNGGAALTDAAIRRANRILDDNNVPDNGRALIIPPVCKETMLGIDKFVLVNYSGSSSALRKGKFGQIYNLDVLVTTNMPTVTNAHGSFRPVFLAHPDAFCSAVQKRARMQTEYQLDRLGTLVVMDEVYGVKALRVGDADGTGGTGGTPVTSTDSRKSEIVVLWVPA